MDTLFEILENILFVIRNCFVITFYFIEKIFSLIKVIFKKESLNNFKNIKLELNFLGESSNPYSEIRGNPSIGRYLSFVNFLPEKKKTIIKNLLKEYENENKLTKRMYYNILYTSKFWGFFYCYLWFSRRKYYYLYNCEITFKHFIVHQISQKYILNTKRLLDYNIRNLKKEDFIKVFLATMDYSVVLRENQQCSSHSFILENIIDEIKNYEFKQNQIEYNKKYSIYFLSLIIDNYQKIVKLTNKDIKLYLVTLLELLFNHGYDDENETQISKRDYLMDELIKIYANNISEVKNYIIKMLSLTIESYIKIDKEKDLWNEFRQKNYSYKIKTFLLLLMKLDEQIDNVMAMVEELPTNLKSKEINDIILYWKLNKMGLKNKKEKVIKI